MVGYSYVIYLLSATILHYITSSINILCDSILKLDVTGVLYVHVVAFTISPSSQVVGVGQMAVFRCQNQNAHNIFWRMNETPVTFNKLHPDPGITISTTLDENNDVVNLLSIDAQEKYNETIIVCAANIQGGGSNDTTPVNLLIQGEQAPDMVCI